VRGTACLSVVGPGLIPSRILLVKLLRPRSEMDIDHVILDVPSKFDSRRFFFTSPRMGKTGL
jgi:hypothetical protein